MASPKISGMIIGTILFAFFASLFALYFTDLNTELETEQYPDGSTINLSTDIAKRFGVLENLTREAESYQKNITTISEKNPSFTDVIGGYFSAGYTALKITGSSFNLMVGMTDNAAEETDLGASGELIKNLAITITIIVVFIGVLLAAILKWVV